MRVLVVYFSRTGHTRRLAERLARLLDAPAEAIREPGTRLGFFGYQRSLFEAVSGRDARIGPLRRDPADFDLVLIGTPVWGWHLSSPVRAFARQWCRRLPRVAFFCTMGGSGERAAFDELRRLVGRRPMAELALDEHEVGRMGTSQVKSRIDRFVLALHEPSASAPAARQAA